MSEEEAEQFVDDLRQQMDNTSRPRDDAIEPANRLKQIQRMKWNRNKLYTSLFNSGFAE